MSGESTRAWGIVTGWGTKRQYVAPEVHTSRTAVMMEIGRHFAPPGETWRDGWKRARSRGWRAVRVTITMESTDGR